jgi:hypothetical protein
VAGAGDRAERASQKTPRCWSLNCKHLAPFCSIEGADAPFGRKRLGFPLVMTLFPDLSGSSEAQGYEVASTGQPNASSRGESSSNIMWSLREGDMSVPCTRLRTGHHEIIPL